LWFELHFFHQAGMASRETRGAPRNVLYSKFFCSFLPDFLAKPMQVSVITSGMGVLLVGFVAISGLAYLHRDRELQHLARYAEGAVAKGSRVPLAFVTPAVGDKLKALFEHQLQQTLRDAGLEE
jgi:hypothetical protein